MNSNWEQIAFNVAMMIVIAITGFLLKRSISAIDKRLENGDEKFKEICRDINDIKEKRALDREYFSKEYISKDDFIRDIHALDYKIDRVAEDVKKLLIYSGREKDHAEI